MKKIHSVDDIADQYSRRILSNIIGKDPLRVMTQTPKRLRKLTKGLKKKQLRRPRAEGKWSIAQIISHLADSELAGAFRLRMIVSQSGCSISAYNEQAWESAMDYADANVDEKIELFTTVRDSQIAILNSLRDDEWEKFGIHEERGKETIERLVQLYAGHDINHLSQIAAIRKSFKKK